MVLDLILSTLQSKSKMSVIYALMSASVSPGLNLVGNILTSFIVGFNFPHAVTPLPRYAASLFELNPAL